MRSGQGRESGLVVSLLHLVGSVSRLQPARSNGTREGGQRLASREKFTSKDPTGEDADRVFLPMSRNGGTCPAAADAGRCWGKPRLSTIAEPR